MVMVMLVVKILVSVQKNNLADAVDQKDSASKPDAFDDACFKLHAKMVCVCMCVKVLLVCDERC
jgi:uncharacterized membrane protein